MLRFARFALVFSLSTGMPALFAIDPPQKQDQNKSQTKDQKKNAEPAKKEAPDKDDPSESRLDRRNSRMNERNRQVDGLVNKPKK
jgi:hypothetical protein